MTTKTITSTALQRRINRALAHRGQVLRKCREGSRYHHERGDFYLVDIETRGINETHVDLETLARELNVLKDSAIHAGPKVESEAPNPPMTEKEFLAMARQKQKEIRVMVRRNNALIKKDRYEGLSKEERADLLKSLEDTTNKAVENVFELARWKG